MKIPCSIRVETTDAYKIETLDYDFPFWVPKSVVDEVHRTTTGQCTLTITDWWWDKFEEEHS